VPSGMSAAIAGTSRRPAAGPKMSTRMPASVDSPAPRSPVTLLVGRESAPYRNLSRSGRSLAVLKSTPGVR
jgi:hypothetical protein